VSASINSSWAIRVLIFLMVVSVVMFFYYNLVERGRGLRGRA